MTQAVLNTQLYQKMLAEQAHFKDWLMTQTPEEVLNHAYEYTCREDILLSLEYNDLSPRQVKALLKSPTPLADVFKKWDSWEDNHHIAEYLMDKDGTTFREVERQNTDKLTEAERLSIYAEIMENDQKNSYVPCNYYCLMDINGDGIEDLLLGETAEYFGNAFTIFNGKGATIRIWSHMNMCKNGILEISGSTPKGEHHHYYRFDANELIHLESVHYNYYPEEWLHELPGSTEFQSITEAEFQTIIASYPGFILI